MSQQWVVESRVTLGEGTVGLSDMANMETSRGHMENSGQRENMGPEMKGQR